MVTGRRTSVRMEPAFWDALDAIAEHETLTINQICGLIDMRRGDAALTASLRVFVVSYYRHLTTWQDAPMSPQQGLADSGLAPLTVGLDAVG